jgi:hypothetical protein
MFRQFVSSEVVRTDTSKAFDAQCLMEALRGYLPLIAHPRGRSLVVSMGAARHRHEGRACRVTNVFDAGENYGLMCQVEVGESGDPSILVTPITELSFDRRHQIARDVAAYRRRRAQR